MANLNFCIPPAVNRKIKEAIEKGELDINDLIKNGSDYRLNKFTAVAGKNIAEKINEKFGNKFAVDLSDEVMDDIFTSFSKIEDLKLKEGTNATKATEWATEYVKLGRRLEKSVYPESKVGIKAGIKESVQRVKDADGVTGKIGQGASELANLVTAPIYKSIKASLDASFALRQGFKILIKSPSTYKKSMLNAFEVFKNIKSKDAMDAIIDEFKAKLISHPNYDTLVKDGKLAVGVVEDWFPTSIAENIPGLGNLFKSSNEAFTIFSQGARFDIANELLETATKNGVKITPEEVKSIATLANSITGRGGLGKFEANAGFLNKLFFSARYIRSQADTFMMPFNPRVSPFVRKEAQKHSLKTLGTIAALMYTASLFGEVEFDPRSSKFGKLRVGDTNKYIDLTAGLGSYVTLAARQATNRTKSGNKLVKLNTGDFGSKTRTSVLFDWASNKLAPAPGVIKQAWGDGEFFGGKPLTPINFANQLIAPISAANALQYFTDENLATALLLSISDATGLGTSEYKK